MKGGAIGVVVAIGGVIFASVATYLIVVVLFDRDREPPEELRCGEIHLEWDEVTRAETYELYRDGERLYRGSDTDLVDRPLIRGQVYTYTLRALNAGGESEFSETRDLAAVRRCPPSDPPEHIIVDDVVCGGNIVFSWEDVRDTDIYQVERRRRTFDIGALLVGERFGHVAESARALVIEVDLEPGELYVYRIRAGNESGWSEWTTRSIRASEVCPPERPEPPRGT